MLLSLNKADMSKQIIKGIIKNLKSSLSFNCDSFNKKSDFHSSFTSMTLKILSKLQFQ